MEQQLREKVNFDVNIPAELTLAFEPKLVQGRFGDQYQYNLEGERITWVEPVVEQQRKALGIGKGEPFLVCKQVKMIGRSKSIEWIVERAEAEPTVLETKLRASIAVMPQQPGCTPAATAATQPKLNGTTHSQGNTASATMTGCLIAAIDAALNAEQYGKTKNMELSFKEEDIRCLAATLYIQLSKQGVTTWQQ